MTNNENNNTTNYIVAAFYKGIAYILQYKGVIGSNFHNNNVKTFKTKETAVKNAYKVKYKYNVSPVKVYQINEDTCLSSSTFKENDNKHLWEIK